jgi:hypothetical protein
LSFTTAVRLSRRGGILTSDDGLAAEAQAEAEKLAGGSQPQGKTYPFNQKSKLGVGAAEGGDQKTWWVLVFAE